MNERPPASRRDEAVSDVLHGVTVRDPYRWLEDGESAETRAWIAAQNAHSAAHLETIASRSSLRERLAAIWSEPQSGAPFRRGTRWFEPRHDGVQNQEVLFVGEATSDGAPPATERFRTLLDVNPLSPDGTIGLTQVVPDSEGHRIAYGLSVAGSDWVTWKVRDVASGRDLDDVVPWSKFGTAAWLPSGAAFLYGSYDPPAPGAVLAAANRNQKIRLHHLGSSAGDDAVVHEDCAHPDWSFDPFVTHDGRWLVIAVWEGTFDRNRVLVAPLDGDRIGAFRPLLGDLPAHYTILGAIGRQLVFLTTQAAPLGRIIAVDPEAANASAWVEIVGEGSERIESAWIAGGATPGAVGWIVLHTWRHATSQLACLPLIWKAEDLDAAATGACRPSPIDVPADRGSVLALTVDRQDGRIHFRYETFLAPGAVFALDLARGEGGRRSAEPFREAPTADGASPGDARAEVAAHSEEAARRDVAAHSGAAASPKKRGAAISSANPGFALLTEQVFVEHDGVRIPVFLLHREDVRANRSVPTILYGYGGFDISITPSYSVPFRVWVERGGLIAVACLRGGGEYGKAWHDAGRTPHKQHVFDDAIAVAEWLTGTATHAAGTYPAGTHTTGTRAAGTHIAGSSTGTSWTCPAQLGILGRSNGGLLVGACMAQRPELFGACVPEVGVMDMLRFHLFTIGWAWVSDYGSAENPAQFRELLAYSPLHNLREGVCYPPTLVTTGDHDDRVVPAHSFKFAARLQEVQGCPHPTLLRVDVAAGHGMGKPLAKRIEERTDVLAFFARYLGLE